MVEHGRWGTCEDDCTMMVPSTLPSPRGSTRAVNVATMPGSSRTGYDCGVGDAGAGPRRPGAVTGCRLARVTATVARLELTARREIWRREHMDGVMLPGWGSGWRR
jgi:hypothetical protein